MTRLRQLWDRARPVVAVPLGAVVLGLVVAGIVALLSSFLTPQGFDPLLPFKVYAGLFSGAFIGLDHITNTLVNATPLVVAGLAVGFGFKAGMFNIGARGQFLLGAVMAAGIGPMFADAPGLIAIPIALIASGLAGAVWGFIPGALKAWTGAHEVVTTIMLNFIGASIVSYLVLNFFQAPGYSFARTGPLGNAELPTLGFLNPDLDRLNLGIL